MVSRSIRKGTSEHILTHAQMRAFAGDAGESRAKGRLLLALLSVFAALAVTLAWLPSAHAADLSASQMKVSLWPEYDDPRVLVINQADLDPSVQLPAGVSFNIPKGAEIGMACEVDSSDGHACKTYQLVDNGDYQTLTYEAEAEHKVFLEYYYDAFAAGTPERSFDFSFRPGFPVKSLSLEVQEPLRSTGFALDPVLSQTATDSQGLTYHTQNYTDVSVEQPLDVKVSYTKTDNNPSVSKSDSVAEAGSSTSASAAGGQRNTAVFAVLGVLAFGGVLFGSYKKLRPAAARSSRSGGRPARAQSDNRQRSAQRGAGAKSKAAGSGGSKKRRSAADGDPKYCTDCGSQLERQNRFCSECGSEQS